RPSISWPGFPKWRATSSWRPAAAPWRRISAESTTAMSAGPFGRLTPFSKSPPMASDLMPDGGPNRLYDRISDYARLTPQAEAAVAPERSLTYAGLKAEVDACAAAMIAAGAQIGDRVATLAAPGLEFL